MKDVEYLKKYYVGSIEEAIQRLEAGEPVQYIVGNVDFYGNVITVNPSVLIPRFETEGLIEKTISKIKQKFSMPIDILDLCTGSGCIAITLQKKLNANVVASDISSDALKVASENIKQNDVQVELIESNLFENIHQKFDVIISNPPYIAYEEEIDDVVKNYEPHIALYADNHGLYFYEEILKNIEYYNLFIK